MWFKACEIYLLKGFTHLRNNKLISVFRKRRMRQHFCQLLFRKEEKEREKIPVHSVEDNRLKNVTVLSSSLSDISH